MNRYFSHLWTCAARLAIAGVLGLVSLSAVAHPGHGKSFGTAEEPNALLWVWLAVLGVAMLAGVWRLYMVLIGSKRQAKSDSE